MTTSADLMRAGPLAVPRGARVAAELFARAEVRRNDCATSGAPAPSADWVMGADNPRLRGAL